MEYAFRPVGRGRRIRRRQRRAHESAARLGLRVPHKTPDSKFISIDTLAEN
jgi:hypothetical protein